ncbi:hypothetical protein C4585_00965 [Candidatus Parcubacteria bacterium]|nr:MAG: hypothetical protein C4585_00965 [Candidatus Parcubacteria bacterium]
MIQRVARLLSSEARTLERAVSILAGAALLSSLLALLRDRLLAHVFGAGLELDLYYAAFRIPDFLFVAIGALVSVYVLIPELTKRDREGEKEYIDTIVVGFSALVFSTSILAALCAPIILAFLFPHFSSVHMDTLVTLTRIMLLQPILLGFSNILAAITQVRARYGLYALSPILYNVGIILGVIVLYPVWGIAGLAWGVVVGALLHLAIQVPSIISDGFFRRIPRFLAPAALWKTMKISVPRAVTLSLNQITLVGLTVLAGGLAPGSIAVLMFAFNLHSVPLAVIGASYSVAAFPSLAEAFSSGKREEFVHQVAMASRHILFWSFPAIGLIVVLRAHIVRTVLGSGAFDWTDTRLTAAAFAIFSLALVAQGLQLLLVRAYYAAGQTLVPFCTALGGAIATLFFGVMFLRVFDDSATLQLIEMVMRVSELEGTAILALALAYSLVSILTVVTLALYFEFSFGTYLQRIRRTFFESIAAAIVGALGAYVVLVFLGPLTLASTLLSIFFKGFAAGVFGMTAAGALYAFIGNQEFGETVTALREKLWRTFRPEENATIVASAEEVTP